MSCSEKGCVCAGLESTDGTIRSLRRPRNYEINLFSRNLPDKFAKRRRRNGAHGRLLCLLASFSWTKTICKYFENLLQEKLFLANNPLSFFFFSFFSFSLKSRLFRSPSWSPAEPLAGPCITGTCSSFWSGVFG